jgi:hypothetical protein
MRLTKDNDLIQALATQRTDQAFRYTILPWRPRRNLPVTDTHRPEPSQKDVAIGAIVVAYQVCGRACPWECLGDLAR